MPRADWRSSGSDAAGFEVGVDGDSTGVKARVWGFWEVPLATAFQTSVLDVCRAARHPEGLTVDAVDLRPQRDEVQAELSATLVALRHAGLARITFVVTSSITKMQLARIAKECGAREWVHFAAPKTAA